MVCGAGDDAAGLVGVGLTEVVVAAAEVVAVVGLRVAGGGTGAGPGAT